MNRITIIFYLLLFNHQAISQTVIELDLSKAIKLALSQNRQVENAFLDRVIQKYDLYIVEDQFLPQYSLNANAAHTSSHTDESESARTNNYSSSAVASLNNKIGGQWAVSATQQGNYIESENDTQSESLVLSYTQPLLKGAGREISTADLTQAQRAEVANKLNLETTLSQLITHVIKTYRSYVSAVEGLKITRLSLQRSVEQGKITHELIKSGRLPAVEHIQSETDIANQQLSLRTAENNADQARVTLLQLLRLKPQTQLKIDDELTVKRPTLDFKSLAISVFTHRRDYRLSLLAVENAELALALAKDGSLWQLDIVVDYNLARTSTEGSDPVDSKGYAVNLQLQLPLSDKLPKRRIIAARIALRKIRNNLDTLKERIDLELVNAKRDIDIRWQQLGLSQRALDLSSQQLELEKAKLKAGRSSNFQVVTFQNNLLIAENNYLNARISYLDALTDLDETLGMTLQHWGYHLSLKDQEKYWSDSIDSSMPSRFGL